MHRLVVGEARANQELWTPWRGAAGERSSHSELCEVLTLQTGSPFGGLALAASWFFRGGRTRFDFRPSFSFPLLPPIPYPIPPPPSGVTTHHMQKQGSVLWYGTSNRTGMAFSPTGCLDSMCSQTVEKSNFVTIWTGAWRMACITRCPESTRWYD